MEEKKVTPFYKHDHDELDGFFLKFQELKNQDYPQAKEYFKKFKFGLQRHIVWEEEILFPLFEEKTGMKDCGPTAVMREEHRQIGEYLEAVHKKVQCNDPDSGEEEQLLWYHLNSTIIRKKTSFIQPLINPHRTKSVIKFLAKWKLYRSTNIRLAAKGIRISLR